MAVKNLGKDFCICRNDGSFDSPSHIPIAVARNIKVANKPSAMINSTDRSSASTVITDTEIPTRRSIEVSFDMMWAGGSSDNSATPNNPMNVLRNGFFSGEPVEFAILNKLPGNGGVGYAGDWLVKKFPVKFPLNDGQMIDITLVPHGNYNNAVQTYTDATSGAGAPDIYPAYQRGANGSVNEGSVPLTFVRDFSISVDWETAKSMDRGCIFDTEIPVKRKVAADLEFMWEESNTLVTMFRDAWEFGSVMSLSILDAPYADGGWGCLAGWAISDYPLDANLNDGQMCKIKLVPHGSSSSPVLFGFAPSFT